MTPQITHAEVSKSKQLSRTTRGVEASEAAKASLDAVNLCQAREMRK